MDHLELDDAGAAAPAVAKQDGRSQTSKANGARGGQPAGSHNRDKLTYSPDRLANTLADRILAGKGIPISPYANAGAPTDADRAHVARITGIPAEEFQAKLSARLQEIAEKAGIRIVEKLDEGNQKLSDLNMTLAISVDKLAAIAGRTAQSGNVSVTVNNYGTMSRSEMLATVAAEAKHAPIDV